MVETVVIIPPKINQYYSHLLLDVPICNLGDDIETFWEIWRYIEIKLWKKLQNLPERREKCERLKREFLDLYVKTKTKKKAIEEETESKATEPLYWVKLPDKRSNAIFNGFRLARYKISKEHRESHEI